MRAARLTGFILLALAALAALAVALLTWLVDAGRFRPQIEAAVESATGRPLQIRGGIDLDLLPFIGIAVRDASLANPPGFSAPALLHVDELTLGARLLPLLRGRFELTRVRLSGAELQLERRADGRGNWEGLGGESTAQSRPGSSRPVSFDAVELRDMRLRYLDAASGARHELAGLDADLAAWSPGQPLQFELRADWVDSPRPAWPIEAAGRIEPAAAGLRLSAARLALLWRTRPEVAGLPLQLAVPRVDVRGGAAMMITGEPIELRFGGDGDRLGVTDWRVELPSGGATAQARLAFSARSLRALLDASGIGAPYTTDARVLGPLQVTATLRQAEGALGIEPLELRLDDTTLRGRIRRAAGGPLELELAGDRMEIARYLEPADAPTPPFTFPTESLRALQARATVTLERATLGEAQLEGVTLRLLLDEQGLRRAVPPASPPKAARP